MIRTQIQLTEEQARELRELARRQGVSMAEVVRQAVERILAESDEEERWRRASAIVGAFPSGLGDLADRHDDYLAEDFQ